MDKFKEAIVTAITNEIIHNIDHIFTFIENNQPIPQLENLPVHYKDDEEIMLGIMKENTIGPLLSYCSDRLKNDKKFVLDAVKIQEHNFSQAPSEIQNNKEFILQCLQLPRFLIEDAPEQFLDDKDCAIAAIKRNGLHSLKEISERLKDDREVAIAAINYQPDCYKFISARLQNDSQIVFLALQNEDLMKFVPEIYRDNKEVMLDFFNTNHLNPQHLQNLQYVSKRLKNDQEIVMCAIKQDGFNLQFAGKKFKNNKNLAMLALQNNGSLEFLSPELRNDQEVVLVALKNNGAQLQFASDKLKNSKDIVAIACESNTQNIQYASLEIKEEIGDAHPVQFIQAQKLYQSMQQKIVNKEENSKHKLKI